MHLKAITKPSYPLQADNLLAKGQSLANLLALVVAAQEVSDFLMKTDTHDNE